ncbi:MAG TPA: fibronectin type III domain-containing protein [Nonomuraea sp.]|nr:fibronectin type III domain-containing protein [Nonomuraea sp.]
MRTRLAALAAVCPTPPSVPGTPVASGVTSTGATLNWAASTDNVRVTGCDVYRAPGTLLGQSATNSITLSGLTPATAYQVYVRARDAVGNVSGQSGQVTFTTLTGGGGGGCTAAATVQSQWSSGYVVHPVTVTYTGGAARNLSYNGALGPNASTAFGFQAGRPNGQTTVPSGYTCAN